MTVEEIIRHLTKMPPKAEVTITDGHEARCYEGDFEIKTFKVDSGQITVDIGIGGTQV